MRFCNAVLAHAWKRKRRAGIDAVLEASQVRVRAATRLAKARAVHAKSTQFPTMPRGPKLARPSVTEIGDLSHARQEKRDSEQRVEVT